MSILKSILSLASAAKSVVSIYTIAKDVVDTSKPEYTPDKGADDVAKAAPSLSTAITFATATPDNLQTLFTSIVTLVQAVKSFYTALLPFIR